MTLLKMYAELFMGAKFDEAPSETPTHQRPSSNTKPSTQAPSRGLKRGNDGVAYREVSADYLLALVESPFAP